MDLLDLRNEFDRTGIMMCFNGPFNHSIIEEIGIALRNHLAAENITQAAILDVFAVYIEMAQNVRNYLTLRQICKPEASSSIITIAHKCEKYVVSSGNYVIHGDGEKLCARIEEVNAMAADEIKRHYREQLRRETKPDALGAGLGFLEIAKRSSEKMICSVRDVDANFGFLSLTAFI